MEILWLAIVIYSIGLGLLLHFRPAYMFHENGSWKEFGYQRDSRHTLFPFWLFAIAWAFVSYVLAASVVWSFFTPFAVAATYVESVRSVGSVRKPVFSQEDQEEFIRPASSMAAAAAEEEDDSYDPEYDEDEEADAEVEPDTNIKDVRIRNRNMDRNRNVHYEDGSGAIQPSARPGYYVIDPSSKNTGIRRYIYYGPTPPKD